jgi:hypothetical protein
MTHGDFAKATLWFGFCKITMVMLNMQLLSID